jgi:hypothetical protein
MFRFTYALQNVNIKHILSRPFRCRFAAPRPRRSVSAPSVVFANLGLSAAQLRARRANVALYQAELYSDYLRDYAGCLIKNQAVFDFRNYPYFSHTVTPVL